MLTSYVFNFFGLKNIEKLSLTRYCLAAFVVDFFPAILIFYIASRLINSDLIGWSFRSEIHIGIVDLFGLTLLAPLMETCMLSGVVYFVSKIFETKINTALMTAFVFACFHGLISPIWFLGTFWPFFVFSFAYISWFPQSFKNAFISACVPHSLHNLTVFILLYNSKLSGA